MSAFAALQKNSTTSRSIFVQDIDLESNNDEDDDIIKYQNNTSDDSDDSDTNIDDDSDSDEMRLPIMIPTPRQESSTPIIQNQRVFRSNFIPTKENLQFNDSSVTVTLVSGQYVILSGECKLKVIKGSIKVNNCHVLYESDTEYDVVALQSQSYPMISHHELHDESVIEVISNFSGLGTIGVLNSNYKSLISSESPLFEKYSFEIVFNDQSNCALDTNPAWIDDLQTLKRSTVKPMKIMIIGNKNTGKSTFAKTLLNEILIDRTKPNNRKKINVDYLDLDPGQSEYSNPYCLSLSTINKVNFGLSQNSGTKNRHHQHYFGYSSSVHSPTRYMEIISDLFSKYDGKHHLIINTPGWIKGFGKELLTEITRIINPDKLIVLTNNTNPEFLDNVYLLQDLTYESVTYLPGIYQLSKFSASQIRTLNKLLYFHQKPNQKYDFKRLLDTSPLRIGYTSTNSPNSNGINAVSILNHDVATDFNPSDLLSLIEVSICGIYNFPDLPTSTSFGSDSPNFINPENLEISKGEFIGLVMIHSINTTEHYMNIYIPDKIQSKIREALTNNKGKLVLIKGEGEIPPCELLHPDFLDLKNVSIPYMEFHNGKSKKKKNKIGGIWKVRKNIMRRGHDR
ncbi:GRC3 Polynucleotide 5'-hydroxyl-kinase GRC3 [Candida maltosa Xu316]